MNLDATRRNACRCKRQGSITRLKDCAVTLTYGELRRICELLRNDYAANER